MGKTTAEMLNDENVEIRNEVTDERVIVIDEMLQTRGWEVLKEYTENEIKTLENNILDSLGGEGFNDVKYTQRDLEKIKRAFYKKLLQIPEEIKNYYGGQAVQNMKGE